LKLEKSAGLLANGENKVAAIATTDDTDGTDFLERFFPFSVTTKVAQLETTKTRSHKGTKKEKILKCLVFLVSLW
jgi:hypothetical protein